MLRARASVSCLWSGPCLALARVIDFVQYSCKAVLAFGFIKLRIKSVFHIFLQGSLQRPGWAAPAAPPPPAALQHSDRGTDYSTCAKRARETFANRAKRTRIHVTRRHGCG
eukprot:1630606-Prymnesium_polylepis.1